MNQKAGDRLLMVVLGVVFLSNTIAINIYPPTYEEYVILGIMLLVSGLILVISSFSTLKRKGTLNLITDGIYAIIRHSMYLGGLIMFISHVFFSQHPQVIAGTIIAVLCCIQSMRSADQRNIQKFGEAYEKYMQQVPSMNMI